MNYDGKATVINTNFDLYYSAGDSATVIDVSPNYDYNNYFHINNHITAKVESLNNSYVIDTSFIANNNNDLQYNSVSHIIPELTPCTVQVYKPNELIYYSNYKDLTKSMKYNYSNKSISFVKFKSFKNDNYKFVTVKVSDTILKTNVFVKETKLINILDLTYKYRNDINFTPIFINIGDKTEFFVPTLSDNYQAMSIIAQKDTFIELKFENTPLNVIGLPEGLQFTLGSIKGTISKSGSYDITIQYEKGTQKLNIIVPYYQRLL